MIFFVRFLEGGGRFKNQEFVNVKKIHIKCKPKSNHNYTTVAPSHLDIFLVTFFHTCKSK